jgi:hypothetical protein
MLDNLVRIAPPPTGRQLTVPAWSELEQRIGCGLPGDYKALVETYGPGIFGGFIHVFQPASPVPAIDLERQITDSAWALSELRKGGERIPYKLDEPAEIIAVGRTDNGDILYLVRRPLGDPEAWTIAVNESRGEEWNEFAGGITDFLASALSGSRRYSVFPTSFPMNIAPFETYDM